MTSDALAKKGHMGHNSRFEDVPSSGDRDDGWDTVDVELDEVVKRCGAQVDNASCAVRLAAHSRPRWVGWVIRWVSTWVGLSGGF